MQLRQLHRSGQAPAASNVAALRHLVVSVAYIEIRVHVQISIC